MKRLTILLVILMLALMLGLASLVTLSARASNGSTSTSSVLPGVTDGSAYAGFLKVPAGSSVASVGPLFPVSLGCTLSAKTVSSSAASMTLGTVASSGSLADTATTSRSATTASVQASSTVQSVNVLAGVITADEVSAVASSKATATKATSTNGSAFTNLVVAGQAISGTPAPNTTITLVGLGSVILNEQVGPVNGANHTQISVTAIDVSVKLANIFGLPIGTHILIAHAQSSFTRTSFNAVVSAKAYGLFAFGKAGSSFAKSGPWAIAAIPCTGGSSTVSVASVNVPGVGSTGTITDMASGQITSSGANASSSSTVQQVNLLKGTITADTVSVSDQAAFSGGMGSASGTTTLVNAVVAGISISANPGPNTKITIAGLGFVIVNEQHITITSTGASVTVDAFDLHVTTANSFGLPVGVRIIVGHTEASVTTA